MIKMSARFKKRFISFAVATVVLCTLSVSAFAADPLPTFDLVTVFTDAASKIVTDLLAMVSGIFPITITLLAASIGIAYGIKFISKLLAKT